MPLLLIIDLGVGGFNQDMEDDMEDEEVEDILRQQQEEEEAARIEKEEFFRQQQEEEEAARIQQEEILRQQWEEQEAARIQQEEILWQQWEEQEAARIQQEEILRQQQEEQEAAQIRQEEILRQQQEEQAAQIQGQQEHRVHFHQHVASVTHFSSGQRFSPKASSNYEMSEKVRGSVLDSTVAKRKQARSELRRSNRVRARDLFSRIVNQIAPSAPEHQRERDALDAIEGEFLSEISYNFPPSEDQDWIRD